MLSAIVNAVGAGLGFKSNRDTNKTNMAINQMNNEFNAAEAEKQRQFQLDMWNKENEYNTASAQRSRLEAAGLNPYMMMEGGSAGVAGSAGSTSAATASPSAPQQSYDWSSATSSIASMIQDGRRLLNENKLANAQESALQGERQLSEARAMEALGNTNWSNTTKEVRKWLQSMSVQKAQLGYQKEQQEYENMIQAGLLSEAQRVSTYISAEGQSTLNKYLDKSQQLDLTYKAASILNMRQATKTSIAQARNYLAQETKAYAESKGQKISNKIAEDTAESLIQGFLLQQEVEQSYNKGILPHQQELVDYDVRERKYQSKQTKRDYHMSPVRVIGNAIGAAVGAAVGVKGLGSVSRFRMRGKGAHDNWYNDY